MGGRLWWPTGRGRGAENPAGHGGSSEEGPDPHPGVPLAHRADGIFHRARADGVTAGSDGAGAEALSEDLEERDKITGKGAGIEA